MEFRRIPPRSRDSAALAQTLKEPKLWTEMSAASPLQWLIHRSHRIGRCGHRELCGTHVWPETESPTRKSQVPGDVHVFWGGTDGLRIQFSLRMHARAKLNREKRRIADWGPSVLFLFMGQRGRGSRSGIPRVKATWEATREEVWRQGVAQAADVKVNNRDDSPIIEFLGTHPQR